MIMRYTNLLLTLLYFTLLII